jgi:DNA-binding CsgD family transcriptional regulator
MLSNKMLEILDMKAPDGTTISVAEKIASMPPDVIMRMLDTHARLAAEDAQTKAVDEAVCRLLADGMPADEIAMILCIKADIVANAQKHKNEIIAKYAKQLKGRRQRAKKTISE